jgi:DNA repair ATPase RecN
VFQIKEILDKLKRDGRSDLSDCLEQIQQLKGQNRVHEKQIMSLVKTTNKLQDSCDQYEKENEALRHKMFLCACRLIKRDFVSVGIKWVSLLKKS